LKNFNILGTKTIAIQDLGVPNLIH